MPIKYNGFKYHAEVTVWMIQNESEAVKFGFAAKGYNPPTEYPYPSADKAKTAARKLIKALVNESVANKTFNINAAKINSNN